MCCEEFSDQKLLPRQIVFQKGSKMASKARKVDDDLANVEFETSEDVEVIPTFDSMGLREDLLR